MTDTHDKVEQSLLPCPFCVGEARLYGINQNRERAHIECTRPRCRIVGPSFRKDQDAIAAWNTRQSSNAAERGGVDGPVDAIAHGFWLDLVEKDDRTSPEEYPDMALISHDELVGMVRYVAALSTPTAEPMAELQRLGQEYDGEALLRAVCDAQSVSPYRGWNLTALNKAVDKIREHLGLPSIRDLNPDIAAMQDAAEANKDAIRALTPTPDRIGKDAVREALPQRCDGIEQPAFEEWAKAQGFDMTEHPLHYLFLDARTDAARQAWCAGIKHASDRIAALSATPAQPVDETERLAKGDSDDQ